MPELEDIYPHMGVRGFIGNLYVILSELEDAISQYAELQYKPTSSELAAMSEIKTQILEKLNTL